MAVSTSRSAGTGGASASFDAFFSQPGGLGPWIQDLARLVAVAVVLFGLLLVARNVVRGRGAAAWKDLVAAVLASAVLCDLSLLGLVTDVAIRGMSLLVSTVTAA